MDDAAVVDEAFRQGWVELAGIDDDGFPVYRVTAAGRLRAEEIRGNFDA